MVIRSVPSSGAVLRQRAVVVSQCASLAVTGAARGGQWSRDRPGPAPPYFGPKMLKSGGSVNLLQVNVFVSDFAAMLEFYRDTLGFAVNDIDPGPPCVPLVN